MDDIVKKVLIVGAGPSGLFLACELARYKVPFTLIDQKLEPTQTSNAAGIQTRTLEIFSDIGIVQPFIEQGVQCTKSFFKYKRENILSFDLTQLDSIYKFILMLPQSNTEKILNQRLESFGYKVERGKKLNSLKRYTDYAEVNINDEIQQYAWVVGCDGAHSKVREGCAIQFPGDDIDQPFIVADIELDGIKDNSAISAYTDNGLVVAIFPLGRNRYRLAANIKKEKSSKNINENDIKDIIKERIGLKTRLNKVSWVSPFWIHSKIVPKMQQGRVFLVGDAAHIHSPVGGQGMNTGLQDAYNIGWKLAYVFHGKSDSKLLDSYQAERWPVIQDIVKRTEKATKFLLLRNKLLIACRNFIFKCINTQQWLKKKAIMQLTQLSIRYKNSPIIDYSVQVDKHSPKPGERAPDIILSNGRSFHTYFDNQKYQLVIFSGKDKNSFLNVDIDKSTCSITRELNENVNKIIISCFNGEDSVKDIDGVIHDTYKIKTPTAYLIRPDNYISSVRHL